MRLASPITTVESLGVSFFSFFGVASSYFFSDFFWLVSTSFWSSSSLFFRGDCLGGIGGVSTTALIPTSGVFGEGPICGVSSGEGCNCEKAELASLALLLGSPLSFLIKYFEAMLLLTLELDFFENQSLDFLKLLETSLSYPSSPKTYS